MQRLPRLGYEYDCFMPHKPIQAEAALIKANATRTQDPEHWRQAVWQWVEDPEAGLAIVLWRRLQAWHNDGNAVWPPGHEPAGACPYSATAKTSGEAQDLFCEQVSDIATKLINHGLPPHWNPERAPLAIFMSQQAIHAAHARIAALQGKVEKNHKLVSLDQSAQPGDPDAKPLLQVSAPLPSGASLTTTAEAKLRLHPDVDPRLREIQVGGMQQQPRLDWDRDPAPRLKDILCREVIVSGPSEGSAWQALLDAHEESARRYHAKRELLLDKIYGALQHGHQAQPLYQQLKKLNIDFFRQPLTAEQLQCLTGWSKDAVYKNVSRYLMALREGCFEVVSAAE